MSQYCAACYCRKVFCRTCKTSHCQCSWNVCQNPPKGPVTHVYINRHGPFGGTVHTTLCGRMASPETTMNTPDEVNCKLCLKRMAVSATQEPGESAVSLSDQEEKP